MKPRLLKQSISRKSLHNLCVRQQKRILNEIKNNLRSNNVDNSVSIIQSNSITQDVSSSLYVEDTSCTENIENSILPLENGESETFAFSRNHAASSFFNASSDSTFEKKLALCFIENNFSHVQGNSILSLLRTHSCFENLPKDTRTLLNTPRKKVTLFKVEPGEYVHFDLETEIIEVLSQFSSVSLPNCIEIDFHTGGSWIN